MLLEKCGLCSPNKKGKMYDFNIKITKSAEMKNCDGSNDTNDSALSVTIKKYVPARKEYMNESITECQYMSKSSLSSPVIKLSPSGERYLCI